MTEIQAPTGKTKSETRRDPDFLLKKIDTYYKHRLRDTWHNRHPMKGKTPKEGDIQVRTNDYLCIAKHPDLIDAEKQYLDAHGHGEAVSRIWLHHEKDILNSFEARAAKLMQAEASVLCNSGYCANTGLIQAIATPELPIYLDMKAHLSLWEGVKCSDGVAIPFRHNDVNHLERQIKKFGHGIVVVDAVYSIDGNVCPVADILDVCERHDCVIIVDETHSFGALGPDGAGLSVAQGLAERIHFRTIGLSKAVPSRGGLVICSQKNAEFLRYESLPTIFSTTVLGHEVAGYHAALDIFANEPWRRERLHKNHTQIRTALDQIGYNVNASKSQIIALEAGDILTTVRLRDALEDRGIFGALFFPPATPEKRCLMRFTINCGLSSDQLSRIIEVCAEIAHEVGLDSWPSTRRKQRKGLTTQLEPQILAA
ncbi:MAG: alpha-hydroxyketone-type quorum-sensing autoinducer synthase [Pseudomonadota bacterium]